MLRKVAAISLLSFSCSSIAVVSCIATSHLLYSYRKLGPFDFNAIIRAMCHSDGAFYVTIAERGYDYNENEASIVAFFPGYPLIVRQFTALIGVPAPTAAVAVGNLFLLIATFFLSAYCLARPRPTPLLQTLVAFSTFPTTFFFHMAYSESLFLCLAILFMLGIASRWKPWVVALISGAATGVRPVGVALLVPLAMYLVAKDKSFTYSNLRKGAVMLLGAWGLVAFMGYQYYEFGDGLAFAKTQRFHRARPDVGTADKIFAIASWEPLWSVYDPGSPGYWGNIIDVDNRLLSLSFANPIIYLSIVICVAVGAWKEWLTYYEVALAVGLLGIPYLTRSYEMCMLSQGRFAALCFPVYIVIGQLLKRLKPGYALSVIAIFAAYFCVYAMLFATGYLLI